MQTIFPDRNISPSFFKADPPGTLLVTSIFFTIQGEGPFAGHPAVFVRLSGCNLGAKGINAAGCQFCDTDFRVDRGKRMTFGEIKAAALEEVCVKAGVPFDEWMRHPLYVITGGEPMLQRNLVDFVALTDWKVQIETNGMYSLPIEQWYPDFSDEPMVHIVVSPKLGAAKKYPKLKPEVIDRSACLKFLLECDDTSPYFEVPDYAFEYPRTVYVSPMAVYRREMTPAEGERASIWDQTLIDHRLTANNYQYAARYALKHGLRLSLQTHLFCAIP
jgi:organic radical activating enzyme